MLVGSWQAADQRLRFAQRLRPATGKEITKFRSSLMAPSFMRSRYTLTGMMTRDNVNSLTIDKRNQRNNAKPIETCHRFIYPREQLPMSRISRINWLWIGCAAVATVLGCLWSGATFVVDRRLVSMGLIWCAILLCTACCRRYPIGRSLAIPLQFLAQLIAASVIFAFLQYPAARIARPLIDAELAAIDRAFCFDWPASFAWVLQHQTALSLLSTVYLSLGLQSALVCFVAWRQPDRAQICLAANALTLTCCLTVFVIWPAGGAFAYYQPAGITSDYVVQFMEARSGLGTPLAFGQMKGIIQFPSYHAAAAVLFGYSFGALAWWIAIPALVIEVTLAISAVPIGGHHLIDVVAGVAVATASLAIAHAFAKSGVRGRSRAIRETELASSRRSALTVRG
jgi:membrane-associated phospholipid phosphatase